MASFRRGQPSASGEERLAYKSQAPPTDSAYALLLHGRLGTTDSDSSTLHGAGGTETPASFALALISHGRHGTVIPPVYGRRGCGSLMQEHLAR